MEWWRGLSRPSRMILVLGTALLMLAAAGLLRADRGIAVESSQAVELAAQEIDFEPVHTQVRLLRQGFNLRPVWAVSFSVPAEGGGFQRVSTVEVDAVSGEVLRVVNG